MLLIPHMKKEDNNNNSAVEGKNQLTDEKCFEAAIPLWGMYYIDLNAPANKNICIRMFSATLRWQKNKAGNSTNTYPIVYS